MNHGGMVFEVNPLFNGMSPSTQNDCVPVTVGVGESVPVRVRVSTRVSVSQTVIQTQSNPVLQLSVQPVTVWVPATAGISNPMQVRAGQSVLQGDEVPAGEIVPEGDTLREFARNYGAAAVRVWAKAQQNVNQLETLAELAKEIAVNNQVTKEIAEEVTENVVQNFVIRLRATATSPQVIRESFIKAGMTFTEANDLANISFQGDNAFIEALEQTYKKSPDILKQADEIVRTHAARLSTLVCPLAVTSK